MTKPMHPDHSMLIRHLDGELTGEERLSVERHVSMCRACQASIDEFRGLSRDIEALVRAVPVSQSIGERGALVGRLAAHKTSAPSSAKVLRRFGWGMAMAAGLALAVLVNPLITKRTGNSRSTSQVKTGSTLTESINVNGESFIPLPYSNPDLPFNSSRIVSMRVPVSALADAGVVVQQAGLNVNNDGTVAANVLLGIDGQPLGVDVLEAD